MPAQNPIDRVLISRIAGNTRWAREPDRVAATAPMRAGLEARYEREVDPDGVLDPVERARRAGNAKRAHMSRLSLLAAQARRDRASTS